MTTEELAECLGVAKQTVNRWIREKGWKTEKFPGVKGGRARLILVDTQIDLFIFSCEGIDSSGALWDSNAINADYKSMLLKRAAQSLLLIDKSKFNRSGEARIGHLDEVTHIISDERQVATSLVTA